MKGYKDVDLFSAETPKELMRAIEAVNTLLNGTPDEISDMPLSGVSHSGSYHNALNIVQDAAGIKQDWVRQARVKWLELGMQAWENWLDTGPDPKKIPVLVSAQFFGPGTMDHHVFRDFLTVHSLGSDCNRLSDRYLVILGRLLKLTGQQVIKKEMRLLIERRTNCLRHEDPHRDETARNLLLLHYNLM